MPIKVMMFGIEPGGSTPSGHTHVHCERYIRLLQLAGCNVTFVEYRGLEMPNFENVTYRRYPRRYRAFEKVLGIRIAHFLRKQSMRLLWRLVRPDICHVHWIDENAWYTARSGLRPLVGTAWGSDLNSVAKLAADDPLRRKIKAALRRLDVLIVDSDDMAATARHLANRKLRTTLLPIGIDTKQFRPGLYQERKEWRRILRIDPDAIVLISPRQLGTNYRPNEIIHAFAALGGSLNKKICLIMRTFGHGEGVSITELHKLADRLNVSDRVRWVADVDYGQLPGLYAASDIAINFPIMDAFPTTFLECFASGLPVISNRLISYESHGLSPYLFFVENDSIGGLTTAIEAALGRLGQLQTLAVEARGHVAENFDERVTARLLSQIYEAVLTDVAY